MILFYFLKNYILLNVDLIVKEFFKEYFNLDIIISKEILVNLFSFLSSLGLKIIMGDLYELYFYFFNQEILYTTDNISKQTNSRNISLECKASGPSGSGNNPGSSGTAGDSNSGSNSNDPGSGNKPESGSGHSDSDKNYEGKSSFRGGYTIPSGSGSGSNQEGRVITYADYQYDSESDFSYSDGEHYVKEDIDAKIIRTTNFSKKENTDKYSAEELENFLSKISEVKTVYKTGNAPAKWEQIDKLSNQEAAVEKALKERLSGDIANSSSNPKEEVGDNVVSTAESKGKEVLPADNSASTKSKGKEVLPEDSYNLYSSMEDSNPNPKDKGKGKEILPKRNFEDDNSDEDSSKRTKTN